MSDASNHFRIGSNFDIFSETLCSGTKHNSACQVYFWLVALAI